MPNLQGCFHFENLLVFEIYVIQPRAVVLQRPHCKSHTVSNILQRLSKRVKNTCQFLRVCLVRLLVPSDEKWGNNQLKFVRRQR